MSDIIEEVAKFYRLDAKQLSGRSGHRYVREARMVAMYLARELTRLDQWTIGAHFRRDRSTVAHAHHAIARRIERNPSLAAQVKCITEAIENPKTPADPFLNTAWLLATLAIVDDSRAQAPVVAVNGCENAVLRNPLPVTYRPSRRAMW